MIREWGKPVSSNDHRASSNKAPLSRAYRRSREKERGREREQWFCEASSGGLTTLQPRAYRRVEARLVSKSIMPAQQMGRYFDKWITPYIYTTASSLPAWRGGKEKTDRGRPGLLPSLHSKSSLSLGRSVKRRTHRCCSRVRKEHGCGRELADTAASRDPSGKAVC